LLLATAMSFTPGPNTMLSAALAARGGLRATLPFLCAVPVGWTLLMLACGAGLGALLLALPALQWLIRAAGVALLLWLAWKLAQRPDPVVSLARGEAAVADVSFFQGVLLQFVNIKAWTLALAITAGWVTHAAGEVAANPGQRLFIAVAVMVPFAFFSNFSYAVLGSLLRTWLGEGQRLMVFNRGMAAVLAVTALWMALS
jgi:threonine/homoserine/homoserine lactone efflux protein